MEKTVESATASRSYLDGLAKRIESCERGKIMSRLLRRDVNCAGTALYLVGDAEKDSYVEPKTLYADYLSRLGKISNPVVGCIVAWTGKHVQLDRMFIATDWVNTRHIGVLTDINPIRVAHRDGLSGWFIKSQSIEEIENYGMRRGSLISKNTGRIAYARIFERGFYLPKNFFVR